MLSRFQSLRVVIIENSQSSRGTKACSSGASAGLLLTVGKASHRFTYRAPRRPTPEENRAESPFGFRRNGSSVQDRSLPRSSKHVMPLNGVGSD
jgi:hypothetical protein